MLSDQDQTFIKQKQALSQGIAVASQLVVERAQGCTITMTNKEVYLDMTSGIGVLNTGHCHPKVVEAVEKQARTMAHAQINMFYHTPLLTLMDRLRRYTAPLDTFCFNNSGSEAVESAIKLARHATKKQNVIVFNGGHHGRTFGAMALTGSKTVFSAGFGPLMSGIYYVDYPYSFRCSAAMFEGHTSDHCVQETIRQLSTLLKQRCHPNDTAAILVEPVLGEGGYVPAPKGFFQALRSFCDQHDILLIADEVQSGFGRTGKMFAIEHFDVCPDILVMAKGIASGYPLSAIVSRKSLMDKLPSNSMGGTYVGNCVSCAAALATLDVFEKEQILHNVQQRSMQAFDYLHKQLDALDLPDALLPLDIRGLGLMIGIEFGGQRVPTGFATKVVQHCREHEHLLLLTASIYETIRIIPPLVVDADTLEDALQRLVRSIQYVATDMKNQGLF
ncbi:pyridoxal phosphate-dependent transferase [Halteromyces radiatus]|uniref:pyridoxal phosphate-dependent transferase n=1 Tax=Halteromyces radiatus TaxID=101107 RepID=UPI0022200BF1|nr:pyridoxal phosphate-dependent transferase [Halteromyces radiatus]KAI8088959.1 pyridoxal phosphate-dependent transferase [Halteromyces radiatus]